MARPLKEGLDYFSLDTDFFQNKKVRRIKMACGPQSVSVLICLLCNIYRFKGYYILWDEDLPFLIADEIGVSEGAVTEVLKKAVQVDFFHQGIFEKSGALTSDEIQKRYSKVCNDSKRKDWAILAEYSIEKWFATEETGLSGVETGLPTGDNPQRKGKERIVKKRKEFSGSDEPAHWKKIVDIWFEFFKSKFLDEAGKPVTPYFNATQGAHLKKIITALQKKGKEVNQEWTDEYACKIFSHYLKKAWEHDEWIRQNFELANLLTKFNSITANGTNKQLGEKPATKLGTSEARTERAKNWGVGRLVRPVPAEAND